MSAIVGVHGINQHLKGRSILRDEWLLPLRDGLEIAGFDPDLADLECAFYGDLFRAPGQRRSGGDPAFRPSDLTADEAELLMRWWETAAALDPDRVVAPGAEDLKAATPRSVQLGLRTLARSRFFAGVAERLFIGALKQVRRYMREPDIRAAAIQRVDDAVTEDTCVLLGHSLGSVVAYEALHRFSETPRWANVDTFVTLGSPLGIPNLIFDSLEPAPVDGAGVRPNVSMWTNISDEGDVVALVKQLGDLFGDVVDVEVDNGATVHDISPYLTAKETGAAIGLALVASGDGDG